MAVTLVTEMRVPKNVARISMTFLDAHEILINTRMIILVLGITAELN